MTSSAPLAASAGQLPSRFGVIGSFPDDEERLERLRSLRLRLQRGAATAAVTTDEIRALLAALPLSGRVEFAAKCLLSAEMNEDVQRQNGALIVQLFRECFDSVVAVSALTSNKGAADIHAKAAAEVNKNEAATTRPEEDEWVIISLCADSAPKATAAAAGGASSAAPSAGSDSSSPAPSAAGLLYLKNSDYFVLHALVAALASFGAVSVTLFDEYFSRTTSTVFRSQFVKAVVAMPVSLFSDERLQRVYSSSVEAVRRLIEAECRQLSGQRAGFVTRIIAAPGSAAPKELIHHATAPTLEEVFLRSVQLVAEPTASGKILTVTNPDWRWCVNWTLHSDVYLRFLSGHLQAHATDPLWCGRFLGEFTTELVGGGSTLPGTVARAIFDLYQTHRPLSFQAHVPLAVREHLLRLSASGELAAAEAELAYDGLERLVPPALVLRGVAADHKWAVLKAGLVRTPDGFAFFAPIAALCRTLLSGFAKKSAWQQPISALTLELIAALSAAEFYYMVFDADESGNGPVASTLRLFLGVSLAIPSIRSYRPVLRAWSALHLAHTPTQALIADFPNAFTDEGMWTAWRESACAPFQRRLGAIAGKAAAALKGCSVRQARTAITSYAGYAAILAQEILPLLERAAEGVGPNKTALACLPVMELLAPLLDETAIATLFPPISSDEASASKNPEAAPGLAAIGAVRAVGDEFARLVVSSLQRSLDFDLTSRGYGQVTAQSLTAVLNRLALPAHLRRFPALGPALFEAYTAIIRAAKLPEDVQKRGFVMVPPVARVKRAAAAAAAGAGKKAQQKQARDAKITWVHVNASHHQRCIGVMTERLEALCTDAKTIPALESVAALAWPIVRPQYFPSSSDSSASSAAASAPVVSEAASLEKIGEFNRFLAAVGSLPASLAAAEKPLLHAALVHHLRANTFHSATSGAALAGWWPFLLSAVDACGADWPSRASWLLKVGDVSLAAVRESLQQATFDRDPQTRLQGYLQLIRASSATFWREFAQTLEFVQRRTKNEAGLYRRDMYQTIAGCIPAVVAASLDGDAVAAAAGATGAAAPVSEQDALVSVQLVADSLLQILRDDISKRDSVAKGIFQSLGRTLISTAASRAGAPLLSIRRAWMMCGLTLDWVLLRTRGGEDACRKYVWPLAGTTFPAEQSVTEETLMGPVRAAVVAGIKGGENAFATLRQRVYQQGLHVHVAPDQLFTPDQAVELLLSSVSAMNQADEKAACASGSAADDKAAPARACDFLVDGVFFPSAEAEGDAAASAAAKASPGTALAYQSRTLQCVQQLLTFCGARWTAVRALVRFFERAVATVEEPARASHPLYAAHCAQTLALFNTARQLYGTGAGWYELPPLARACDALFASAVRRFSVAEAQALRPLWTEMKMHRGKVASCAAMSLEHLGFLVANVVPMRGRHALPTGAVGAGAAATKSDRLLADKADTAERAATVLRDLLSLSPSALHLVWSELLTVRDDIFSLYLGRTRGELFGLFDPAATANLAALAAKAAAEPVWFPISSVQLVAMNAGAISTFTRMCLDRALNQTLPAAVRSAAITQFVESPGASHLDVIALIKKLQAIIAKRTKAEKESKEKKGEAAGSEAAAALVPEASSACAAAADDDVAADDAVDLLLESVILRVFSTDATWFILAHLLHPTVIASAPQRTTAAILTNLRLWAPVDRTVAVLRVLLEPHRRWAVGFFLHKQILRLLFECSDIDALARQLFLAEWQRRGAKGSEMPADVRHDVVKMCVAVLNERSEEKQTLAWTVVEDLVSDAAAEADQSPLAVDPATLLLLFAPNWQPIPDGGACPSLAHNAVAIGNLVRFTAPPRVLTAGVESPHSFGHFHSQLGAEPAAPFSVSTRRMCERMAALMEKLSAVSRHPFVRALSQLQQFLFSSALEGLADDRSVERLQQLLMQATIEAADCSSSVALDAGSAAVAPVAASPISSATAAVVAAAAPQVAVLDHTLEWSLQVIPRLFAGLSLQVLTRALVTPGPAAAGAGTDADRSPSAATFARLCQQHPYAERLRATVAALLTALLHTPPAQAQRRVRVAKALTALMGQVSQTSLPVPAATVTPVGARCPPSWAVDLIQAPFKDLLNFLRQDSAQLAGLLPGVEK